MADFAKESSHWYLPNGDAMHTIIGANGNERPTTLRDARKLGLLPSVTGIIRMAAAPALEKWKRNQVLLSAMTLPRIEGESSDSFVARVEQDWQEQGRDAADRGTEIHGAIEKHYRGIPSEEWFDWVITARVEITSICGEREWSAERSFASPIGYGGKTDLHCPEWVIDVKTKDWGPDDAPGIYDEHLMQLAAYREGLGLPDARCGILFVNRSVPKAALLEASPDALRKARAMFNALLNYWCAKNNYWPANAD